MMMTSKFSGAPTIYPPIKLGIWRVEPLGIRQIPVVAASIALRTGCDDFLAKPYYPEQMRAMINKHLPKKAAVGRTT